MAHNVTAILNSDNGERYAMLQNFIHLLCECAW